MIVSGSCLPREFMRFGVMEGAYGHVKHWLGSVKGEGAADAEAEVGRLVAQFEPGNSK
jgi:hypothetical protein